MSLSSLTHDTADRQTDEGMARALSPAPTHTLRLSSADDEDDDFRQLPTSLETMFSSFAKTITSQLDNQMKSMQMQTRQTQEQIKSIQTESRETNRRISQEINEQMKVLYEE